jgi:hypothetical protein
MWEVIMHAPLIVACATVVATCFVATAQESDIDGSAQAIRTVIAGKKCVGLDILAFGKSAAGVPGTFERTDSPAATYAVGYGTILIRRGEEIHGHVASVSPQNRMLYLSKGAYRCGM